MTTQPSQQPDGVPQSPNPMRPVIDVANQLLMIRPVEMMTGIHTAETGERYGILTLRDQGTTFTVYLPAQGLSDWVKVLEQLQRDLSAPTGNGLIIPGIQRGGLNGHRRT